MRPTIERLAIYQRMLEVLTHATLYFGSAKRIEKIMYRGKPYACMRQLLSESALEDRPVFSDYPELFNSFGEDKEAAVVWASKKFSSLKEISDHKQTLKIAIELCQTNVSIGA